MPPFGAIMSNNSLPKTARDNYNKVALNQIRASLQPYAHGGPRERLSPVVVCPAPPTPPRPAQYHHHQPPSPHHQPLQYTSAAPPLLPRTYDTVTSTHQCQYHPPVLSPHTGPLSSSRVTASGGNNSNFLTSLYDGDAPPPPPPRAMPPLLSRLSPGPGMTGANYVNLGAGGRPVTTSVGPTRPVTTSMGPGRPVTTSVQNCRPVTTSVGPGRPVTTSVGPGRPVLLPHVSSNIGPPPPYPSQSKPSKGAPPPYPNRPSGDRASPVMSQPIQPLGAQSLGPQLLGAQSLGVIALGAQPLGTPSVGAQSLSAQPLGTQVLGACGQSVRQTKTPVPVIMQSVRSMQVQKPVLQTAVAIPSPPLISNSATPTVSPQDSNNQSTLSNSTSSNSSTSTLTAISSPPPPPYTPTPSIASSSTAPSPYTLPPSSPYTLPPTPSPYSLHPYSAPYTLYSSECPSPVESPVPLFDPPSYHSAMQAKSAAARTQGSSSRPFGSPGLASIPLQENLLQQLDLSSTPLALIPMVDTQSEIGADCSSLLHNDSTDSNSSVNNLNVSDVNSNANEVTFCDRSVEDTSSVLPRVCLPDRLDDTHAATIHDPHIPTIHDAHSPAIHDTHSPAVHDAHAPAMHDAHVPTMNDSHTLSPSPISCLSAATSSPSTQSDMTLESGYSSGSQGVAGRVRLGAPPPPPPPLANNNYFNTRRSNEETLASSTSSTVTIIEKKSSSAGAQKTMHHSPIPERKMKNKDIDSGHQEHKVKYTPEAYKFYMEQHVENVLKSHEQRKHREMQLVKEMKKIGLSSKDQLEMKRVLCQKESNFIRLKRAKMNKSMFQKLKTIGVGAFGEVALVRKTDCGKLYAMKTLRKSDVIKRNQIAHVKAERDILAESDNDWVVKLYYSFQDVDNLYFIMDYIPGGDLMSLLIKFGVFQDALARFYIGELTLAVESVHRMGFIHRDIKPDNILIDLDGHIKLTDFGLCTGFRWTHNSRYYQKKGEHARQESMDPCGDNDQPCRCNDLKPLERRRRRQHLRCLAHSLVGTPNYIAPEVLARTGYTQLCDWWSVGVILYEMLVGQPPFLATTPADTQYKVLNWQTTLRIPPGANLKPDAQDLIRRLCTGAENRLGCNVQEIKDHPYFNSFDWNNIRKIVPMYVPRISHSTDTSNFDPIEADRLRSEQETDWEVDDINQPLHGFFGFTFRRFFDSTPSASGLSTSLGSSPATGASSEDRDGQHPVYV